MEKILTATEILARTGHGGQRQGAGRKPVYNEPLQRVYVPLSMVEEIKTMIRDRYMTK